MKLTPINILTRLASTEPVTPIRIWHPNTNKYIFISEDTQSGKNIIELRSKPEFFDYTYDFKLQLTKTDNEFRLISNSDVYVNQGLTISSDSMSHPIVEVSSDADQFELIKLDSKKLITWLINDELGYYITVSQKSVNVTLSDQMSKNGSDNLFQIFDNNKGQFSIQHISSEKYLGMSNSQMVMVDFPYFFVRSGVNPYLMQDASNGQFLYVQQVGNEYYIYSKQDLVEDEYRHFTIKEPENLFMICNSASQLYLYPSSDTQDGNNILEAKPLSSFPNPLDACFTIKIESDVSILVTCAVTSNPDIEVYPDFNNIQKWANTNNFFIYGALHNNLVPIPTPNPWPQSLIFDSKNDFRSFLKKFISDSLTNNLIIYYAGHGSQDWVNVTATEKNVAHYLCILPLSNDWYSDEELTSDLNESLSFGKRVYLIFDCCYSGGDVNPWQLQHRFQHDIIGYFAANSEILSYGGSDGGVFTNSFLKYVNVGVKHFELDERILDEIYVCGQWESASPSPVSSTTVYSRPRLCIEKFCE